MSRFSYGLLAVLAAACVSAQAQISVDMSATNGAGTSLDQIQINNIKVNPGNANYNVVFRFDAGSLHLIPESITPLGTGSDCATAAVTVTNATTGALIPGATVAVGSVWGVTNAVGVATLSHLPAGNVSAMGTAGTFVPAMKAATLSCNGATNNVAVALTPLTGQLYGLNAGQFRVVLTWSNPPAYLSALNASMTGPVNQSTSRWHVWGSSHGTDGGVCGLVSEAPPSTITCFGANNGASALPDGLYRYAVQQSASVSNIPAMGASVRLEFADGTSQVFTPPSFGFVGAGDAWTVFEITVAGGRMSLATVNTLSRVGFVGDVR